MASPIARPGICAGPPVLVQPGVFVQSQPNGNLENLGTNLTHDPIRETKPISGEPHCGTNPMVLWVEFRNVITPEPRKMGAWGVRNWHRRPHRGFDPAPSLPTKSAVQNEPNGYLETLGANLNAGQIRETKPISGAADFGTNPMAIWVDS